jgi:hypothetical protein
VRRSQRVMDAHWQRGWPRSRAALLGHPLEPTADSGPGQRRG